MYPNPPLASTIDVNQNTAITMIVIFTAATALVLVLSKLAMTLSRSSFVPWSVWRLYWRTLVALVVNWALSGVILTAASMPRGVALGLTILEFPIFFAGLLLDLETYRSKRQPTR